MWVRSMCQNTTTVCLLQHDLSLMVLPFHTTLLSQLVPHFHFGKVAAWKTESHQVAERTLWEDFGIWNFCHFEALRECTGVFLAGFWMDIWIYPGFQVTQSLGSQKTPGIAQKGSNFVDISNKLAAGRGLILDFFVPYAHTDNWTESLTGSLAAFWLRPASACPRVS